MNIFIDLPFEFLRKIELFSFGTTKFIFMIYNCSYIIFIVVFIDYEINYSLLISLNYKNN